MQAKKTELMSCLSEVLLDERQIREAVAEMGRRITEDYRGKEPILVCILKGAAVFYCDLIRSIDLPLRTEFMMLSSYADQTESSGRVRIKQDLDYDIKDRDVLIAEDIVDTGRTLQTLIELLKTRNAASIKVAALLDKPSRRQTEFKADYVCFEIPDVFVVGYGLDYAQKYRNLPVVGVLGAAERG